MTLPLSDSKFIDHFAISLSEITIAHEATAASLNMAPNSYAAELFDLTAAQTSSFACDQFISALPAVLSAAGQAVLTLNMRDQGYSHLPFRQWRNTILRDPVYFSDLTLWCLLLAAHEASCTLQLTHCPHPASESHLTGMLLSALAGACEKWRTIVEKPLARRTASLHLHSLDLTLLGGEQSTGGDFGLILELSGPPARVLPLVFQAKRYVRPYADVSQMHAVRGYQLDLLGQQKCASAYIFYENGKRYIQTPLPPLIKRVKDIASPTKTDATQRSVDLPTYLVNVLSETSVPTASSAEEALRMIFARADPSQLSKLAVIASDKTALARYDSALEEIMRLRSLGGSSGTIFQGFD